MRQGQCYYLFRNMNLLQSCQSTTHSIIRQTEEKRFKWLKRVWGELYLYGLLQTISELRRIHCFICFVASVGGMCSPQIPWHKTRGPLKAVDGIGYIQYKHTSIKVRVVVRQYGHGRCHKCCWWGAAGKSFIEVTTSCYAPWLPLYILQQHTLTLACANLHFFHINIHQIIYSWRKYFRLYSVYNHVTGKDSIHVKIIPRPPKIL